MTSPVNGEIVFVDGQIPTTVGLSSQELKKQYIRMARPGSWALFRVDDADFVGDIAEFFE